VILERFFRHVRSERVLVERQRRERMFHDCELPFYVVCGVLRVKQSSTGL
jgi:hypothetical protein